jgi:hypothetical protein
MSCHLGCPRSSQSSQRRSLSIATDDDSDSDSSNAETSRPSPIDLTESPVILSDPLPELALRSSTLVSPTMQLLNIELAQLPPRTVTLPTPSQTNEPLVRSSSPQPLSVISSAALSQIPVYTSPIPPSITDLASFETEIHNSGPDHLRNAFWHIRSESLETTVSGLLAFIIQARHKPDGPFKVPPEIPSNFMLLPRDVHLDEIWTMHWVFRA